MEANRSLLGGQPRIGFHSHTESVEEAHEYANEYWGWTLQRVAC